MKTSFFNTANNILLLLFLITFNNFSARNYSDGTQWNKVKKTIKKGDDMGFIRQMFLE